MARLPEIKARIGTLGDLRGLIRAMRALAATHVQECQAALLSIGQYRDVIKDGLAEDAGLVRAAGGQYPGAETERRIQIVICSEQGFVGVFNDALLDRATAACRDGRPMAVIGQRGALRAAERGLDVAWSLPGTSHVGGALTVTRRIADRLAGIAAVDIVFAHYRKGGTYEIALERILPLATDLLEPATRRSPPLHHLAPEVLLERLAGEYRFAEIARAIMESLASENGARLRAMEAVDGNIGGKLTVLQRQRNRLRQELITLELLDIVVGAKAIRQGM